MNNLSPFAKNLQRKLVEGSEEFRFGGIPLTTKRGEKIPRSSDRGALSVIILTKNEESNIKRCIDSVKKISEEIIVVDDNSVDETVDIAKKLGAKVFRRKLEDFSKQRNFGLKKAKGDWVLFLDADEIIDQQLSDEIVKSINSKIYKGYYLTRKDVFLNQELKFGEAGRTKLLRLAKKGSGVWTRSVHETWKVKGFKRTLKSYLYHNSRPILHDFLEKINIFSGKHALSNNKEGKKASIAIIILWPMGKFFYNYILKLGFLDGTRGFVFAGMMSSHSFLAWSKLWMQIRARN